MDQDAKLDMSSPPDAIAATAPDAPDVVPWFGREGHSFRMELARAMQGVADRHRKELTEAFRQDADDHVDRTRARAALETGELRRMADADVAGIGAWCDDEIARIRAEASRRTDDRRHDLDGVLDRHDRLIDAEIGAVSEAVRTYQLTLDDYFDDIANSLEPAYIARQVGLVPAMPDLEVIRGGARAQAVEAITRADEAAESTEAAAGTDAGSPDTAAAPVGVMDPAAIGAPVAHANPAVRLIRSLAGIGQSSAVRHDHQEQPH